jgi:GNAT superfamily N-acetyltransferase
LEVEIFQLETPSDTHWQAIRKLMVEYNREKLGEVGVTATIALGLRNQSNEEVKGGLWGEIYWNWLTIYLLIIPQNVRGQGIGSNLLQRAEAFARQNGCIGVYLDTFSFQAPDFYRKHGYEVFGDCVVTRTRSPEFFFENC